ncbi:MAG: hypothetical protein ACLSA6_08615 [Holdemania massiliensis]
MNVYLRVKEAMQACTDDLSVLAKTLSKGLLMGARETRRHSVADFRGFISPSKAKRSWLRRSWPRRLSMAARLPIRRSCAGRRTILTVVREASAAGDQYMKEHPEATIEDVLIVFLMDRGFLWPRRSSSGLKGSRRRGQRQEQRWSSFEGSRDGWRPLIMEEKKAPPPKRRWNWKMKSSVTTEFTLR